MNNPFFKFFRSLPRFKGKAFLGRKLLNNKQWYDGWIIGQKNIKYHLPNLFETISFDIFLDGVYEPNVSKHLIHSLPKNGVFIDIGINIGSISVPIAKSRPDCKIIGIEASKKVFDYLIDNIRINEVKNIHSINKAISSRDGEIVSFFSPDDKFGKGSMSPVFTSIAEKVETITIDTLITQLRLEQVDAIKVDVEGYEYFVFQGGEKLLTADDAPDIIFEFVDWAEAHAGIKVGASQEILRSYGYKLYDFNSLKNKAEIHEIKTKDSMDFLATKRALK